MKKSLKSGTRPLISKKLSALLANENEISVIKDDFDKIIAENKLRIQHFAFFRDLDLIMFILNNRHVIQRTLSSYPELNNAIDYHLLQYSVSEQGIHWPDVDADISLRGLLFEETLRFATANFTNAITPA